MNILTRIGISVAHWLLRLCGSGVGQAAGPVSAVAQGAQRGAQPLPVSEVGQVFRPADLESPTHLTLTRDRYGRFRPKDAPPPGTDPQSDLLEEAGITPKMQQAATVSLALPDDIHDLEAFQRRLREYVAFNMDGWITGRSCSVGMAFAALMNTYAIDRRRVQARLDDLRAAQKEQAAHAVKLTQQTGLPVRNGLPVRTEVKGNYWYAYPAPEGYDPTRHATTAPPPADLNLGSDSSLTAAPAPATAWQPNEHTELVTPKGSAQSGTDATRGPEVPRHSSNPVLCDPLTFSRARGKSADFIDGGTDAATTDHGELPHPVGAERSLGPLWTQNPGVANSPQRRQAALPPYEHVPSSAEQALPFGEGVERNEQRAASPRSVSPALAWRRGVVAVDTLEHAAAGADELRPYDVTAASASSDPGGTVAAATEAIQSGSSPSVSRCLGDESTVPLSTDPPRAAASTGEASPRPYADDGFDMRKIQAEIDALLAPINAAYATQHAPARDAPLRPLEFSAAAMPKGPNPPPPDPLSRPPPKQKAAPQDRLA